MWISPKGGGEGMFESLKWRKKELNWRSGKPCLNPAVAGGEGGIGNIKVPQEAPSTP